MQYVSEYVDDNERTGGREVVMTGGHWRENAKDEPVVNVLDMNQRDRCTTIRHNRLRFHAG